MAKQQMKKARDSHRAFDFLADKQGTDGRLPSLECRTRSCGARASRVVTDDARLVSEERALTARADDGRYRCRSIRNDWCSARARGREAIAALLCRH